MNLTTLEQSKKLKEWGAPQDTFNWWAYWGEHDNPTHKWQIESNDSLHEAAEEHSDSPLEKIAAYDLESLILWLGDDFKLVEQRSFPTRYVAWGWKMGDDMPPEEGDTLVEAVYAIAKAIHQPNN